MTLIFSRPLQVVKVHVSAKFHQPKCSGSLSYRDNRERKTAMVLKAVQSSLPRTVIIIIAKILSHRYTP